MRLIHILSLIKNGDKPAIDSVEAGITVKTRQWNLEEAKLKLTKSKLELANFLWIDDNIPLELQDTIIPEEKLTQTILETLKTNELVKPVPHYLFLSFCGTGFLFSADFHPYPVYCL